LSVQKQKQKHWEKFPQETFFYQWKVVQKSQIANI